MVSVNFNTLLLTIVQDCGIFDNFTLCEFDPKNI